jgi:hypothetical protein
MYGQQTHSARIRRYRQIARPGVVLGMNSLARARGLQEDRPMRCVSSGYLSGRCSCSSTIPAGVVEAAWANELERAEACESRFFHCQWRGSVWLAAGLADGQIRGAHGPTHRAERDARSSGCEAEESMQPIRVAAAA